MTTNPKYKSDLNAEVIAALRLRWPTSTAKNMARRWGKAVITMKLWMSQGIPVSKLPMILEDLDKELEQFEQELTAVLAVKRAALKRGLHDAFGSLADAGRGPGDAVDRQTAPGNLHRGRGV